MTHASRHYARPDGAVTRALDDVELAIPRGVFAAVVGRSGSGKSTLMNLIAGIDRATAGSVAVLGTRIDALDEDALAAWRGRNVGVVFQSFQLLPTLTVLENVELPMDLCGTLSGPAARARAMSLLERMGVGDQADKLPATLSGGQQQRVAIARALANDPALVVADEPTGNLDAATAARVVDQLAALTRDGRTVVIVTHDPEVAARAELAVRLADGRLIELVRGQR
ncbi:MAG: ABC transporter ATP-binding protein [Nannocystaceae bacterium]|nr:ABC transporter ATP-binding protein [Nannocystaceae bacterium]